MIVATGPLTSEALSADIARLVGAEHLYFYDAISPIVLAETIDLSKVFRHRDGIAVCGVRAAARRLAPDQVEACGTTMATATI